MLRLIRSRKAYALVETSLILVILFPLFLASFGMLGAFRTQGQVREMLSNALTQFSKSPYKMHGGDQDYWIRTMTSPTNSPSVGEKVAIEEFMTAIKEEILLKVEKKINEEILNCDPYCTNKYAIKLMFALVKIDQNSGNAIQIKPITNNQFNDFNLGNMSSNIKLEEKLLSYPRDLTPFPYAVPTAMNGAEQNQNYGNNYSNNQHNTDPNYGFNYLRHSMLIGLSVEADLSSLMSGRLLKLLEDMKIYKQGSKIGTYKISSPRLVF